MPKPSKLHKKKSWRRSNRALSFLGCSNAGPLPPIVIFDPFLVPPPRPSGLAVRRGGARGEPGRVPLLLLPPPLLEDAAAEAAVAAAAVRGRFFFFLFDGF